MTAQPAESVLAGLGVTLDLDDGDLVANAVVIAKVVGDDGQVGVVLSTSDGTSWLDQLGLIAAAQQIIRAAEISSSGDD